MGVENAWNPLLVALVATGATVLQILAGFWNCDFLSVEADAAEALAVVETSAQMTATQSDIGVLCDGDFYDLEDDDMRQYSQYFYYGSAGLGCLTTLGAWAISTCLTPTLCAWRIIPVLSSLSALSSLPVFLIVEIYPCDDFDEQSCSLSWGAYYWIAATTLLIVVTALTQFLDPPEWVSQLHHWRLAKVRTMETTNHWSSEDDEEGSQDPILTPRLNPPKTSLFGAWRGKSKQKATRDTSESEVSRQIYSYALPTAQMEQTDSLIEEEVVTEESSTEQPEKAEQWIPFEPTDNSFREKDSVDLGDDVEKNLGEAQSTARTQSRTTSSSSRKSQRESPQPLDPPSLPDLDKPRPVEKPEETPITPPIPHYRFDQVQSVTISPLTHPTFDSAPGSPSIERTTVHDPILRHDSRVSTPDRSASVEAAHAFLNGTQHSTPVKQLWSQEESVLDGPNGDESLLDTSIDRAVVPFIPTAEESKRMATHGYSVYADLSREDEEEEVTKSTNHPQYNIDDVVNKTASTEGSSLLGAEEVRAIALEGTPIYASLLLEQDSRNLIQIPKEREDVDVPLSLDAHRTGMSTVPYMTQTGGERRMNQEETDASKSGKSNWNLGAALRRPSSGYDKLDDTSLSDEDANEEPPMTEVSFDPNNVQDDTLDKEEIHPVQNKSEESLLNDWNRIFDAHGPIPVKLQEGAAADDEDNKDEEELLRLISSEDFSDESPKKENKRNEESGGESDSPSTSSAERPPRGYAKTTLRPKRRARRSRSRASGSVGSSPSLLDVTIEEETPSDLDEFNKDDQKTSKHEQKRPMTPLAGFAAESGKKNSNVSSSLNMTGLHSYRSVEYHRPDELEQITAGVQEILRRSRGRSDSLTAKEKVHTVRSLSPSATRVWRSERENRAGIHDPVLDSSDEDDQATTTAEDLRQSRIQRLQNVSANEITAIARAKMRRDRFFGDMKPRYETTEPRLEAPRTLTEIPKPYAPAPTRQTRDPPAVVSPGVTCDDGSNTTTPEDVGEVGSFLIGALNLELNDLDVSLAALSRPDGSEYGPDEHSI